MRVVKVLLCAAYSGPVVALRRVTLQVHLRLAVAGLVGHESGDSRFRSEQKASLVHERYQNFYLPVAVSVLGGVPQRVVQV